MCDPVGGLQTDSGTFHLVGGVRADGGTVEGVQADGGTLVSLWRARCRIHAELLTVGTHAHYANAHAHHVT